jgi:hypothetical protein
MKTSPPGRRISLTLLVALLLAGPALAERTLIQTNDGITVEEQPEPGRTLPVLFGTTTMSATPQEIAAWIGAVHTYTEWQHNCEEARSLPQPDGTRLSYNRIASPWPVSDRDVVLRSQRADKPDGSIHIEFRNTDAANAPQSTGAVRMPRLQGSYELVPVEDGTRVVYTLDSDPGGSLPTWLVRQASKDLPFKTLKNLRARAEAGPPPQP